MMGSSESIAGVRLWAPCYLSESQQNDGFIRINRRSQALGALLPIRVPADDGFIRIDRRSPALGALLPIRVWLWAAQQSGCCAGVGSGECPAEPNPAESRPGGDRDCPAVPADGSGAGCWARFKQLWAALGGGGGAHSRPFGSFVRSASGYQLG